MKLTCAVAILSLSVMSGSLWAADPQPQSKDEITRVAMQANKKAIVANNMNLTADQEKTFWPLYDEYQIEINKLNADRISLIKKFAINFESMSDDLASELLDKVMDVEKKRLATKKVLIDKFGAKFPPKVVARYFQLENKLEAAMVAEAAGQVPLMK